MRGKRAAEQAGRFANPESYSRDFFPVGVVHAKLRQDLRHFLAENFAMRRRIKQKKRLEYIEHQSALFRCHTQAR